MATLKNKKIIGIYHKDCLDGTTAAAILLKKYPRAILRPLSHRYKDDDLRAIIDEVDQNTIVYIVDFSLREGHTERLLKNAHEIINIDHHIGAEEKLHILEQGAKNFTFIFDIERSGASLTWIHFFGKKDIPRIIQYVEDSDIWRFTYGDETRAAVSFLYQFSGQPEAMLAYIEASKDTIKNVLKDGKMLKEYRDGLTEILLKTVQPLQLKVGEHGVPVHNTPEFLRSDVGHLLAKQLNKTVATFVINKDTVRLHFRGAKEHSPSALELAKILGGGGHLNAAAASVSLKEFCKMIIE